MAKFVYADKKFVRVETNTLGGPDLWELWVEYTGDFQTTNPRHGKNFL